MPNTSIWRGDYVHAGESILVWSWDQSVAGNPTLVSPKGQATIAATNLGPARGSAQDNPWWLWHHTARVGLPTNTPPGPYTLKFNNIAVGEVQVLSPRSKAGQWQGYIVMPPGANAFANQIEKLLASGPVLLAPGVYETNRTIIIPPNRTITGYGATIKGAGLNAYRKELLRLADDVTLEGLTLQSEEWVSASGSPSARGVTFKDVTLRDCALGMWGGVDSALFERVTFDHASAYPVRGGQFRECQWSGRCRIIHSFLSEGDVRNLALVDCSLTDTDRGLIFRNGWGPTTMPLGVGVSIRYVEHVSNGNEVFLTEGDPSRPGLIKGMFFGTRIKDCEGQINLYNGPVQDLRFWDLVVDGGGGFLAFGLAEQRGIHIADAEFRRCGVTFSGLSSGRCERCGVLGFDKTRMNQFAPASSPYTKAASAFQSADAATMWADCHALDLPADVAAFTGGTRV